MPNITGFAYTIKSKKKLEDSRLIVIAQISAGDGTLTYPANGIPLSAAKLGLPYGQVDSVVLADGNSNGSADGLQYKWDNVNSTIRVYQDHTEVSSGSATPQPNIIIEAKGY